jgi:cytochrome c-type biogenesis protein
MKTRTKAVITVFIVATIIIASAVILILSQDQGEESFKKAPDFILIDTEGNETRLSNLTDRVVVLDFMYIGCTSCLDSERNISAIYSEFKREIFVLSIDTEPTDTTDDINQYRIDNQFSLMNWTFAKDQLQTSGNYTHQSYEINVTTAESRIFIINKDGYITFEKVGTMTRAELENELDNALVVRKAPDFSLVDIDGEAITLSNLEGKIVVLDFMFIDCPSCVKAEKNLKEIFPEFEDEIHVISIDSVASDTNDDLKAHRDEAGITFENWTIARDAAQQDGRFVYQLYSVSEYVTIFIIDKEGYKTFDITGAPSGEDLRREINEALAGAEPEQVEQISNYLLAIIAGTATFFSPCAFPMLPGYMAYYLGLQTSETEKQRKRPYKKALLGGFSGGVGIIIVYVIIGVILLMPGAFLKPIIPLLGPIMGILLITAGALMLVNIDFNKLIQPLRMLASKLRRKKKTEEVQSDTAKANNDGVKIKGYYIKLFRYGVAYGAAASACVAPLFIVLVTTASAASIQGTFWDGIIVLLLYALVVISLMIIVTMVLTIFGQKAAQKLSQYTEAIKKGSAIVLIIVGIYLIGYYIFAFII